MKPGGVRVRGEQVVLAGQEVEPSRAGDRFQVFVQAPPDSMPASPGDHRDPVDVDEPLVPRLEPEEVGASVLGRRVQGDQKPDEGSRRFRQPKIDGPLVQLAQAGWRQGADVGPVRLIEGQHVRPVGGGGASQGDVAHGGFGLFTILVSFARHGIVAPTGRPGARPTAGAARSAPVWPPLTIFINIEEVGRWVRSRPRLPGQVIQIRQARRLIRQRFVQRIHER